MTVSVLLYYFQTERRTFYGLKPWGCGVLCVISREQGVVSQTISILKEYKEDIIVFSLWKGSDMNPQNSDNPTRPIAKMCY